MEVHTKSHASEAESVEKCHYLERSSVIEIGNGHWTKFLGHGVLVGGQRLADVCGVLHNGGDNFNKILKEACAR